MTARNFDALFSPRSIALIGASDRPGSVGQVLAANLLEGGFRGDVMFVNPHGRPVLGREVHRSLSDLSSPPDLAVIATPAPTVAGLVRELGGMGCRAAVVISAGFEGDDEASVAARQALLDASRPHLLRIVGPNCLGVLSPPEGVNASFARGAPPAGGLALVAQSGAVAAAALDWAPAQGLGFSRVVTLGDSLDVDVGDLVDYLGRDAATEVILLYVESLRDARKFMSAARFAARAKPVIVLKGGRSEAGAHAAFSHTRALAGADKVYSAAFRRAGVLQVDTLEELLGAAAVFAAAKGRHTTSLTVLTNGGGAGVLAVDALTRAGGALTSLSEDTRTALRAIGPAKGAYGNPVDILGDAGPEQYESSLSALLAAPEVGAVLAINCPTAVADSGAAAQAVVRAAGASAEPKLVLSAWLGAANAIGGRAHLAAAAIPGFVSAEAAAVAFVRLDEAGRLRDGLLEAPDPFDGATRLDDARAVVSTALRAGRTALDPLEVQALLAGYGVPFVETRSASSPDEAAEQAAAIGGPVALKIQSPDITHKTDVGGVRLGLAGPEAVRAAAHEMMERIAVSKPGARLDGFIVQAMAAPRDARELLAGVVRDPTFGPVVLVGHGGVAVEVLADREIGLPPLNPKLAAEMIGRTRVSRLLASYRGRPAADTAARSKLRVARGQLTLDHPEIAELDLNPVLCGPDGVLVLDARVAVRAPAEGQACSALVPYPSRLTHTVTMPTEALTLRAIRPGDAKPLMEMVDRCTPLDRNFRFGGGLMHLDPAFAARLCQIDYDRQMALVAETAGGALHGVVRLVEDPEGDSAEFALMVRSDQQGHGLGRALLAMLLDYAAARGLKEVWGETHPQNLRMLALAEDLGFTIPERADEDGRLHISRSLAAAPSPITAHGEAAAIAAIGRSPASARS